MNPNRKLIFLSHATPEDNDFVFWLGARLASAGYEVWSDITKLIGGEIFWNDIEDAIRNHSAKVVSVLSTSAPKKPGFMNELTLALQVERFDPIEDFVIPVRIDDIPFSQFPVEIIRKNAIDAFSDGWHKALAKILKKLGEDNVPRNESVKTDTLSEWSKSILNIKGDLVREEEEVVSNWLPIKEFPLSIRIHSCRPGFTPIRPEMYSYPTVLYGGRIVSFARAEELISQGLEQECEIPLDNFLRGGVKGLFEIHHKAAANALTTLTQNAWLRFANKVGLNNFQFANNKFGSFLPLPEKGIERVKFLSPSGKKSSRALMGRSEKRNVYWHYAPEFVPTLGNFPRFTIFSHVIFTRNGKQPIGEAARMHSLRRTFCKSWWQDRWRDLNYAFLAYLTDQTDDFQVPLAGDRDLIVGVNFQTFRSPVTAYAETDSDAGDIETIDDDFSDEDLDDLEEFELADEELDS